MLQASSSDAKKYVEAFDILHGASAAAKENIHLDKNLAYCFEVL